jgi:hypothetical protein
MKSITTAVIGIAVAAGLTLGTVSAVSAQGKAGAARGPHAAAANKSKASEAGEAAKGGGEFKGIAAKLGTTSDALESSYQTAKQANPKLTRGQFISANVVAHNLGSKNPAITTPAILSGLQGGKSLGQTLQGLGLSESDAQEAERQARREVIAARRTETEPMAAPSETKKP